MEMFSGILWRLTNGVVTVLLVVVEDALDRLDTWVLLGGVGLSS